MKKTSVDLWFEAKTVISLVLRASIDLPVAIWDWLKKKFKKKEPKDMAMFHCSDCGNDFEAERHIMDLTLDDYGPTMTALNTIYCPSKCPKCGNWATTQKTIQTCHVPCAED